MSEPLTPERETKIRERTDAATPGPWFVEAHQPTLSRRVVSADHLLDANLGYLGNRNQPEAEFIAHARDDVPALLAEIDRLRAERNRYRNAWNNARERAASAEADVKFVAPEAVRVHHCPAEYGGPGYSHCELTAGHDGQHEAAMGNMRRATWGGDL